MSALTILFFILKVATVTFAFYIFIDEKNVLDSNKVFVSLTLFNILKAPLTILPSTISNIIQASVSLKRIQNYLLLDELNSNDIIHGDDTNSISIKVENANLSWSDVINPELESEKINLKK